MKISRKDGIWFMKRIFKPACSFIKEVRVVGYSMFRASKKEFSTKYYFEEGMETFRGQ